MIKNSKISLRTLLFSLLILFSLVPILLANFIFNRQFEKAINLELKNSTRRDVRQIQNYINEFSNHLKRESKILRRDSRFNLFVSEGDSEKVDSIVKLRGLSFVPHINIVYNSVAQPISYVKFDELISVKQNIFLKQNLSLSVDLKDKLETFSGIRYFNEKKLVVLEVVSKIFDSSKNNVVGYLGQYLVLSHALFNEIQKRVDGEFFVIDPKGDLIVSSVSRDLLSGNFDAKTNFQVNLGSYENSFLFNKDNLSWGTNTFSFFSGISKEFSNSISSETKKALLSLLLFTIFVVGFVGFLVSNSLLQPLFKLTNAIQLLEGGEKAVQIDVQSKTEIGDLAKSFNKMSHRLNDSTTKLEERIVEIDEANKKIKRAQSQIVQSAKMASLGQLVAGVAHELNNPISFIYSNISPLKEYSEKLFFITDRIFKDMSEDENLSYKQIKDSLDSLKAENDYSYIRKDLPKVISSFEEGAQRTKNIVEGLKTFSRLDEAQLKKVQINDGIRSTLDLLKSKISENISISLNLDSKLPEVNCYASQLNQVFMNLIFNAIQAIGSDPGKIEISSLFLNDDNQVEIIVSDNGDGIPKESLENIFEPFFTTKKVGEGTGLGLSISYNIIKNHGGEILVDSQQGLGTTFKIILPFS